MHKYIKEIIIYYHIGYLRACRRNYDRVLKELEEWSPVCPYASIITNSVDYPQTIEIDVIMGYFISTVNNMDDHRAFDDSKALMKATIRELDENPINETMRYFKKVYYYLCFLKGGPSLF